MTTAFEIIPVKRVFKEEVVAAGVAVVVGAVVKLDELQLEVAEGRSKGNNFA